jgi:hypothetical protein
MLYQVGGQDESRVECSQRNGHLPSQVLGLGRSPARRGFTPRTKVQTDGLTTRWLTKREERLR